MRYNKDWHKGFAPLSRRVQDEIVPFTGSFDGNNFQISLYINRTTEDNIGIFGTIAGSKDH